MGLSGAMKRNRAAFGFRGNALRPLPYASLTPEWPLKHNKQGGPSGKGWLLQWTSRRALARIVTEPSSKAQVQNEPYRIFIYPPNLLVIFQETAWQNHLSATVILLFPLQKSHCKYSLIFPHLSLPLSHNVLLLICNWSLLGRQHWLHWSIEMEIQIRLVLSSNSNLRAVVQHPPSKYAVPRLKAVHAHT